MTKVKWSGYQNDIFDAAVKTENNLLIHAAAGSGKSTTAFELIDRVQDKYKHILVLSFNRKIRDHAHNKLKHIKNCSVSTFHSYGAYLLQCSDFTNTYKSEFDKGKVWNHIMKSRCDHKTHLFSVISFIRQHGIIEYDAVKLGDLFRDNWYSILKFGSSNADAEVMSKRMKIVAEELMLLDNNKRYYDFDDMIRFPLIYKLFDYIPKKPNLVVVDEAQDLNQLQLDFIKQFMRFKARVVAVGDRHQAIYEFRGADIRSLDNIKEITKAKEFPLSVSYRCKSKIVEYTRLNHEGDIDLEIEPNEIGGKVLRVDENLTDPYQVDRLIKRNCQMVVSPKNKHLVAVCVDLIIKKIPCSLKGSSLPKTIRNTLKDLEKSTRFTEVDSKLVSMLAAEQKNKQLADTINCVIYLLAKLSFNSYSDVYRFLDDLESKDTGIALHTVHSAKGLEAESVWLINDFWKDTQTDNLKYVARTRASDRLYICHLPKEAKKTFYVKK